MTSSSAYRPVRPQPVHAVVLAAGRGSRLGALGDATPKWLLPVAGRTLADRHLEGIARAAQSVASVRVVVGHAAAAIELELAGRAEPVGVVANPEYAELNNWWSLLRALRELPDDGPVVLLNADLLVEPEHVTNFIEEAASGHADGVLAVDLVKSLTDESMKVSLTADDTLQRIGKVDIVDPAGEYIGMLMARGPVLRHLRAVLEGFVGRSDATGEWYEGAVGRTAAAGVPWHVWAMAPGAWVEIDDDADLAVAETLAAA
ncbi:MAG TPA: NTP transferase domain-containing protein [Solirubrobacteraceae bacterium]|nr:NTP transferase domain-containing protein [Solirubrobacteraceae bacterium]